MKKVKKEVKKEVEESDKSLGDLIAEYTGICIEGDMEDSEEEDLREAMNIFE